MTTNVLDARTRLIRFCYLGNFESIYRPPRGSVQVSWLCHLEPIIIGMKPLEFGLAVGELLQEYELPRKDETFFAIAAYLEVAKEPEWRTNIRISLPTLIKTADDLFLFCKYSRILGENSGRAGFSRTTKKAIISWYAARTPDELRAMWLSHRGLYGFTHKRLIKTCYIKDEILGDSVVAGAFFKTCSELIKHPHYNIVTPILYMSTLRTTDVKNEALKIVNDLKLKFDQVPPRLSENIHIAQAILPQMSILDVVTKWHFFTKHDHFEKQKFFKMVTMITDRKAQEKARIHPTLYLLKMDKMLMSVDKYAKPKTYMVNRADYFRSLFFDSFGLTKPTGLRSSITLTLQHNYKKKFLTRNKNVTYFQAAVTLAFSIFKQEKHTDIFAYTDDKVKLRKIQLDKARHSFNDALRLLDALHYPKSSQRLVQPLMEAIASNKVYDLILIIVPTAGRSNPNQNSNFLCKFLDKYRETKNKHAKLVIVSLLRKKASMMYSQERNENILEICGLDENTANIIESFALDRFG